jgi:hypothetical protein
MAWTRTTLPFSLLFLTKANITYTKIINDHFKSFYSRIKRAYCQPTSSVW